MSTSAPLRPLSPLDELTWQQLEVRARRVRRVQRRWMLAILAAVAMFGLVMTSGLVRPRVSLDSAGASGQQLGPHRWRYTMRTEVQNNAWTPVTVTGPATTNAQGITIVEVRPSERIPAGGAGEVTIVFDLTQCRSAATTQQDDPWLQLVGHTWLGGHTIRILAPGTMSDVATEGC